MCIDDAMVIDVQESQMYAALSSPCCDFLIIMFSGFNVESFAHRDLQITAWDIGSRDKMVRL